VVIGRRWKASVTVHEDVDAAAMAGAAGVHLPSGGNPEGARTRLPGGLVGASAHSAGEASALLGSGADYVTISPVFVTDSKPGYGPAIGLDGLAEIVARVPGRVIALGGINAATAPLCLSAGASGVAVMGEVMRAPNPQAVVKAILAAISGTEYICG
jgi:thiamine-phosphate pyrophosphorylase